jgi:hypothetical protein
MRTHTVVRGGVQAGVARRVRVSWGLHRKASEGKERSSCSAFAGVNEGCISSVTGRGRSRVSCGGGGGVGVGTGVGTSTGLVSGLGSGDVHDSGESRAAYSSTLSFQWTSLSDIVRGTAEKEP